MTATEKDALKASAIAALRAAIGRGVLPADIARAIKRGPDAVGRYITGETKPPPSIAEKIIKFCRK